LRFSFTPRVFSVRCLRISVPRVSPPSVPHPNLSSSLQTSLYGQRNYRFFLRTSLLPPGTPPQNSSFFLLNSLPSLFMIFIQKTPPQPPSFVKSSLSPHATLIRPSKNKARFPPFSSPLTFLPPIVPRAPSSFGVVPCNSLLP